MRRRGLATLALVLLVLSAGCLAGGTGPLHPPGGPADEQVTERQPGGGDGAGGGGPDGGFTTVSTPSEVGVLNHSFRQSALNDVVLNLTVRNNASEARRAQLVGAIEYNGSTRRAFRQTVLDPGETGFVELSFDVQWTEFGGNLTEARVVWTEPVSNDGG
jgi:hypothetical protein